MERHPAIEAIDRLRERLKTRAEALVAVERLRAQDDSVKMRINELASLGPKGQTPEVRTEITRALDKRRHIREDMVEMAHKLELADADVEVARWQCRYEIAVASGVYNE